MEAIALDKRTLYPGINVPLIMQALLMDGYVKSVEVAKRLLEDMLRAEKEWLPNYWFNGKSRN